MNYRIKKKEVAWFGCIEIDWVVQKRFLKVYWRTVATFDEYSHAHDYYLRVTKQ